MEVKNQSTPSRRKGRTANAAYSGNLLRGMSQEGERRMTRGYAVARRRKSKLANRGAKN